MKLLVPVYDLSLVDAVCKAAKAGGHIAAVVNPDSGPGRNKEVIKTWKPAIAKLQQAGAQVLYYVDLVQFDGDQGISVPSGSVEKSETTLKAEMSKYLSSYAAPVGWFFDDLRDFSKKRNDLLTKLVAFKGGFTVANPGTSDAKTSGYLASNVTVLVTSEHDDYTGTPRPAWEASKGARLGVMALGEEDFASALQLARQRQINLFYATEASDSDENPYENLPGYFKDMAAAVV